MPIPNSRNGREFDKFVDDGAGNPAVRVALTGGAGTTDTNLTQIAGNAVDVGQGAAGTGTQRVTIATDDVINVNEGGNTTILSGSQTVATAGTPVQLIVASTAARGVVVQADPTNTGNILVGNVTSQDVVLFPGDSVSLDIDDLNKVYIDSTVNGEGASYLGSV